MTRYWAPSATQGAATDLVAWLEEFDVILRDAVRIRLRSDVPLGSFLSGGIDSSVISMLAAEALGRELSTYTVDFDDQEFSEGPFAGEVARHLGTHHLELEIQSSSLGHLANLVDT
jgi:asparagine synthase (glutamine-hydrolysing)